MAVLTCSAKTFKYTLFVLNLLFVLIGLISIAVGTWLVVDDEASAKIAAVSIDLAKQMNLLRITGMILAAGGTTVLLVAFFGCCGAIKEWRPLLVFYAICIMLVLSVEISAVFYFALLKDTIELSIQTGLLDSITTIYNGTHHYPSPGKTAWDKWMQNDECCGVTGSIKDFEKSIWRRQNPYTRVPAACCPKRFTICTIDSKYDQGCYTAIRASIASQIGVIIGVGLTVALVQLMGLVFALCLCKAIGDEIGNDF